MSKKILLTENYWGVANVGWAHYNEFKSNIEQNL